MPDTGSIRQMLRRAAFASAFALPVLAATPGAAQEEIGVAVIIKTATNPFYFQVQKGAEEEARKLGNINITTAAGKDDFDDQTQIAAIENAIARGDKGILIIPTGQGVYSAIDKARQAGIFVIALDAAPDPLDTVDITFATDNFLAGKAIGEWAAGTMKGKKAVIAMINYTIDVNDANINRNQGFLDGMGIDTLDAGKLYDEPLTGKYSAGDYEIACSEIGHGTPDGGRTAMENCLSKNPDINLVYAINEPSASGAYEALRAAGKEKDVVLVTVDGSCEGVRLIKEGVIGADSQQYPYRMASLGVEAIKKLIETGEKPRTSEGRDFFNTGVELITDKPVDGVKSITSDDAAKICWGN